RDSSSPTLLTKSAEKPFAKLSRLTTFTTSPATAGSIVNPISSVCSPKVPLLCPTVPPSLHTTHVPVAISLCASTSQILTPSFKSTSVSSPSVNARLDTKSAAEILSATLTLITPSSVRPPNTIKRLAGTSPWTIALNFTAIINPLLLVYLKDVLIALPLLTFDSAFLVIFVLFRAVRNLFQRTFLQRTVKRSTHRVRSIFTVVILLTNAGNHIHAFLCIISTCINFDDSNELFLTLCVCDILNRLITFR